MTPPVAGMFLAQGLESVQFLNELVGNLWPYMNVAASAMIKDTVEPLFGAMLPGPFSKTTFSKIDLGPHPVQFDRVDSQTRTKNYIKVHLDFSWNGNCDIDLNCPIFGSVGVESVKIRGRLSVVMQPLIPALPVVSAVQFGFINPPDMDVDFTGAADVLDFSLFRGAIRKIMDQVFAGMFVLPNRFLLKFNPMNDFFATYILPLGYLRLTLERGTEFKTTGIIIKDVPDMYCILSLGGETPIQSGRVDNDNNPVWNERFDFLYSDPEQIIKIHAWEDDVAGDDDFGVATVSVGQLLAADGRKELPLLLNGEETGATLTVSGEIRELSNDRANFELASEGKHDKCGLLTIAVAEAVGIPDQPDLAPYCKVTVRDETFVTPTIVEVPGIDPRSPPFDTTFRVQLTNEVMHEAPGVKFELLNKDAKMGEGLVEFGDVFSAPGMAQRRNFLMNNGAVLKTCVVLSSVSPNS